jgi:hypothetical protein
VQDTARTATAEPAAAKLKAMNLLKRLATGQTALWRVFWFVGTPLELLWYVTGACMVFGFGVEELFVAGSIIALFSLASLTIPFVSIAIWRSASNYPRKVWWHTGFAWGAKAGAVFSGLKAGLSVIGLIWLGSEFVEALFLT